MKKFSIITALAFFAASFISCEKDYTCECTIDGVASSSAPINKAKKNDAQTACDNYAFDDEICTLKEN